MIRIDATIADDMSGMYTRGGNWDQSSISMAGKGENKSLGNRKLEVVKYEQFCSPFCVFR